MNLLLSDFHRPFLCSTNQSLYFHIFHCIQSSGSINFLLSDLHCLFLWYYNPESVFSYFPQYTVKWQYKLPSLRFLLSVSVLLQPRVCIFLFSIIYSQVAVYCKLSSLRSLLSVSELLQPRVHIFIFSIIRPSDRTV